MLEIKNKIEFESNLWIGELDASNWNSSEEARIKAVTNIATICSGKLGIETYMDIPSKKQIEMYNRLLTESAGKSSTPFEFIPVTWEESVEELWYPLYWKYCNAIQINEDWTKMQSNLRNILNNYPYKDNTITFNTLEQVKDFKVIVGQVPKQVYDHIVMHRSFSRISESSRNKRYLKEVQFWIDSKQSLELQEIERYDNEQSVKRAFEYIEKGMKPEQATKRLPCTRLIKFALGAWLQDKNSWENLFNVRAEHSGTQEITQQTIDNIKSLIL